MKNEKCKMKNKGFVALITVLIILVVTLIVGLGLGLRSISEAQMGLQKNQSSQAYYLANLCAEKALVDLKETNGSYLGTGGWLNIENGSCNVLVEGSWIVKISAIVSNQVKKIKIIVTQINPKMTIGSWQEVANF